MPVLQHPSGRQPERVVLVRGLGRRLVGQGEDVGLAIGVAVELPAGAGLDVGILALAVAPARLLAVDHRPADAARLVVLVERGQVVPMAAAEGGVFLEEAFLQVEAEGLRLVVGVGLVDVRQRELVDMAVAVEHVIQRLAAQAGFLVDQFLRPDLLDLEALGELHQLPEVGARVARRLHQLVPEVGAALGVAVGAFLLDPHRAGQDQVGGDGGHRRVDVGDDDEVLRIAVARVGLLHQVGAGLHVVVDHHPVGVERAVLELAVLLDRVIARLGRDGALGQAPDLLGMGAVLGVGHHHVRRQPVREGADLARGAAGRGLPRQRERAVARRRDLAGQQMDVVDEVVGPGAPRVLVEAHGPERGDLGLRIRVQLGQRLEPVFRHAGQFGGVVEVVLADELRVLVEGDGLGAIGVAGILRGLLQRVLRPQAVADVRIAQLEVGVLLDELLVDAVGRDDVVGDVVEDRQVGLRLEDQLDVGQLAGAVLEGRQHRDLHVRAAEPPVGDAGPQHRMHLGHVGAPQHEDGGVLDVVVAAHRLVHAEGPHEAGHRRGHAVARVGIEVVAAEARLHQLGRGVALPDRPLARAEHAHRRRSLGLERLLELLGHHVEGAVPAHRLELAVLGVLAVLHPQQRRGEPVRAVHDLGQEVALDAVQAAVDFRLGVALGRDDAVVLDRHLHVAAGAAEAARRLGPGQLRGLRVGAAVLGQNLDGNAGHGAGGDGGGMSDEVAASAHGRGSS